MNKLIIFVLFCLIAVSFAKVDLGGWELKRRAHPNQFFKFTLALKMKNVHVLEKIALDVSNPDSKNYGKYLSRDEVLAIVSPDESVTESIMDWFEDECSEFGFTNQGDSIIVYGPAKCAEKALNIDLFVYQHEVSGVELLRRHYNDEHPVLPKEIQQHIDMIIGVSALPRVRIDLPRRTAVKPEAETFDFNIPDTLRKLYNIPTGTKSTNPKNSQAVLEFLPVGGPLFSDIKEFSQEAGETFNNISRIVGPYNQGQADGESTLDVEYITTLGAGVPTTYITVDTWIYGAANTIFNLNNPPLVVSVSYGWMDAQTCETQVTNAKCNGETSQQYILRTDKELMKLVALGISFIVCAQDEGAPSDNNEFCSRDNNYPLWPIYPASSNWVTTVSSTTLPVATGAKPYGAEPPICTKGYKCTPNPGKEVYTMANNTYYVWSGGSGFGNYTARPTWQDDAVNKWLSPSTQKDWPVPPTVFFNPNNRAYPDVATVGDRILIYQNGFLSVTAGTSASTPIFAAIVSLLNDARLNAGKKPLGFLAPLLYKIGADSPNVFNDVTQGTSAWSRRQNAPCKYGYGTSAGWDPATGWGSVNYGNMLNYLKNVP